MVPHLNNLPHLGRSISLHHIVDVRTAIRYNIGENGVEIGLAQQKGNGAK